MKNKSIFFLSLILLAIFIIGAASASEDFASDDEALSVTDGAMSEDTLAVNEEGMDIEEASVTDMPSSDVLESENDGLDSNQAVDDEVILGAGDLGDGTNPYHIFVNDKEIITDTGDEAYDENAYIAGIILPHYTEGGHMDIFTDDDVEIGRLDVKAAGEGPWRIDENDNLKAHVYLKDIDLTNVKNGDNVNFIFFDSYGKKIDEYVVIKTIEITDSHIKFLDKNSDEGDADDGVDDNKVSKLATNIAAPKVIAVYKVSKYLVATLKDKKGNVLKNVKVSIKINGKTYFKTTNSKGKVKLLISNLVPKKYTAIIKFAGDKKHYSSSLKLAVLVKKAKPKLVLKKKTFKVNTKTKKYAVTLKTNKGKALKKAKLTLRVNGKTYKAKTNKKGKAIFRITKLNKKGTFNAVVKFAGNKYYKKLSKTVKLTAK